MSTITIDMQQYEALVALARRGATADQLRDLESFIKAIEKANGISRDLVWVQWQELDQPVPATVRFPETWPPEMRYRIELISRKVCRADVDAVLTSKAIQPENVLCTKDPGAVLGWTPVDQFFI